MQVLVLIANPAEPALDGARIASIASQLGGEPNVLAPGIACEIASPKSSDPAAEARALLGDAPVDVALVPAANRRKKLLIADMDSTMIEQECIDELADALGIRQQIAEVTERAMRGELEFESALKSRVALLKGLTRETIADIRRERITLSPGGRTLVQTMKAHGAYTSLVSGGFTLFADHVARRIGFDEAMANTLEFDGEQLIGTVTEPILGRLAKRHRLESLVAERGLLLDDTIAVGDGANDLDMLSIAGFGVALHAKPAVAEKAGIRIDHGDLTALLYLQGYTDEEMVR